jgi:hypothetical protein
MSEHQNQPDPTYKPEVHEQFHTYYTSKQLAHDKIQAREKLLSMPPEIAQKQVEQTLYPQHWEYQATETHWEESIPTSYGETDP